MTSTGGSAATGIATKVSPHSVSATVDRLTEMIHERGMKLFVVIDQAAEARRIGLELRPTTLVVFGNPAAGTAVMDAVPLAAVDLPLRIVVWADGDQTKVSYLATATLTDRYGLSEDLSHDLSGIDQLTDTLVTG